jgi:membrane protease YdiL (CAAX protease family)
MQDSLGEAFRRSPTSLGLATFLAMTVWGFHLFGLISPFPGWTFHDPSALLPLIALPLWPVVARGQLRSVGLRLRPIQGWSWWLIAFGIYLAVASLLAGAHLGLHALGWNPLPNDMWPPDFARSQGVRFCVIIPLLEETIYRLAVCVTVTAWLDRWWGMGISWALFVTAHVVGGNVAPDNVLAGALFAWAFVHSECFLVPVALHALSNVLALITMVLAWQLLRPSAEPAAVADGRLIDLWNLIAHCSGGRC